MESKEQVKKKWDFGGLSLGVSTFSFCFLFFYDETVGRPALLAVTAIILGIIGICKKADQRKVRAIIGIVLSVFILVWIIATDGITDVRYPLIKMFEKTGITNINTIIDKHIEMREAHPKENVFTSFAVGGEWKGIQLRSGPEPILLLDVFFNNGNLRQQMEHERFKRSKYYSYFVSVAFEDFDYGYSLVLNADRQTCVNILSNILINVFEHPTNTDVLTLTEKY